MGVDVTWYNKKVKRWCGVQRKEMKDFIASVQDGRLSKEVAQMQADIHLPLLVLEGRPQFSLEGQSMVHQFGGGGSYQWTRSQHFGMVWSLQLKGIWVCGTDNTGETVQVIQAYQRWLAKDKHQSLDTRPGPTASWGTVSNEDYQRHLVSGLPGVGPELAGRIVAELGVPFGWKVSKDELMEIKGLGKVEVDKLWECLDG